MTTSYSDGAEGDAPTFRVRSPEDLLALAPVIIGFRLEQDVVLMTFGGLRPFSARMDLPRWCTSEEAAEIADALLTPARANRATAAVLLFFSDEDAGVRRAWRVLAPACDAAGIHVIEALRADGRRYYPLLAADRRVRQHGVPYDVADHPFLAQAVLAGRVVHTSRAALAAGFDPAPEEREAVQQVLREQAGATERPLDPGRLLAEGAWVQEVVGRHVAARTVPAAREAARLLLLLQTVRLRDAAWWLIRRPDAREHHELWRELSRRAPEALAAPPLALAGWAAWLAGDGASAWIAVDRCREVDPGYALADLIAEVLDGAVPPDLGAPAWDWRTGLVPDPPTDGWGDGDETWVSVR